jgi:ubiquinone/menaquinone biosynthesis C-methylase UbiE
MPAGTAVHARSTSREASDGELRYRLRCIDKFGYRFRGDERLLDAGCGNGGVARLLRERVGAVVAVDVEPSPAWRDGPGLEFLAADAEQLPFPDASFELVHSKDSLHHMRSPERAIAEYRRVLKPGGTALILESNRYNPSFYIHMTRALGHEHFTRSRFRTLVSAGFPEARFGFFEAHYVPRLRRLLPLQHAVEETLERLPPFRPFLAYNLAVASLPGHHPAR